MNVTEYLFEKSAHLEKDFILGNKETISFKTLHLQSSQMASYIFQTVGSEKNILLASTNNSFFLIGYLGIMLSGNVCIPVNPVIEKENLDYILKKGEVALSFVEKKFIEKFSSAIKTITEESYGTLIANRELFQVPTSFSANNPALIIFTSGSTGRPKGVILSHNNIIANTNSIIEYLHLNTNDIIETVLPFFYSYGLSLLHTHLRVGGSMVLNNNFVFIYSVLEDIQKYNCTGLAGVPSHFQILLSKSQSLKKMQLPSLKYVTQAGGKLHTRFIKEFKAIYPDVNFHVMYGQTEATSRLAHLPPKDLFRKPGSIGKAIPGVELKVVNETAKEIQVGEIGEIVARGKNVMLGYFMDSCATENAIKDNWLHTGDMGTIDNEGYIYLTSRQNDIIKVLGKRVCPKEIEETLLSFPDIIDCQIEAIEDKISGEAIKATVIVNKNSKNNITEVTLKKYCAAKLTSYKIPQIIEIKQTLNISATGKKIKATTL